MNTLILEDSLWCDLIWEFILSKQKGGSEVKSFGRKITEWFNRKMYLRTIKPIGLFKTTFY